MKKILLALAVLLALAALFFLFAFKEQKSREPEIKNIVLARFVDTDLEYIPSDGSFYRGGEIYFIAEIEKLSSSGNIVSFRADAEIINLEKEEQKTFSGTILEETKKLQNSNGEISVAGSIHLLYGGKEGKNILRVTILDKLSGKTKTAEKSFTIRERRELDIHGETGLR